MSCTLRAIRKWKLGMFLSIWGTPRNVHFSFPPIMYPLLPKNVFLISSNYVPSSTQECFLLPPNMYPPLSLSLSVHIWPIHFWGSCVCCYTVYIISKEEEKCVIHTCSYVSDVLLEMQSKVCVRKQSFANSTQ